MKKEKEIKLDNVDIQIYNLIEKKSHTTTKLSEILEKLPTAISRSLKKLKQLNLAKTFSTNDKRIKSHVGVTVPDINKYKSDR
jgi:predicted transcriptional regulator